MPRKRGFCINKDQYQINCLLEFIEGRRRRKKLTLENLGEMIDLTQQAITWRMNEKKGNGCFTYIELVKLFRELDASPEEIVRLMKPE